MGEKYHISAYFKDKLVKSRYKLVDLLQHSGHILIVLSVKNSIIFLQNEDESDNLDEQGEIKSHRVNGAKQNKHKVSYCCPKLGCSTCNLHEYY